MKKIFSLFIIAAMILTMSITSFAATVSGMKTTITETDTDITVTVTVGDVTSFSGFTSYIITDKVSLVSGTITNGETTTWDAPKQDTTKTDGIKITNQTTDSSKYITTTGEVVVLTYKVTKNDANTELSAADFAYGTGLKKSVVTCTASGFYSAKNPSSVLAPDAFTVEYVDNRTKDEDWTETDGTTTVTVKFPTSATEKAGDVSSWTGNASTQASKKAVKFGKNETGAKMLGATVENGKLVVNNADYFVEYDGKKYYGLIDVEAGKSWAILIIESVSAN